MRVLLLIWCSWSLMLAQEEATRLWSLPGSTLSIALPISWTGVADHAGAELVVRSALPANADETMARERGIIAVAVQSLTDEGPMAFTSRCRRDLERTVPGLQLSPAVNVVLGGQEWVKHPYRMQVGQYEFSQVLYTTVIKNTGICLTCSSTAAGFPKWQTVFDAAIASLGRSRLSLDLK
jgi:hypothetical protein